VSVRDSVKAFHVKLKGRLVSIFISICEVVLRAVDIFLILGIISLKLKKGE